MLFFFWFSISISFILFLLLLIAYTTLLERKILGSFQRRLGPNIVGFFGLLQPFSDALKLLAKELVLTKNSDIFLFLFSPFLTLSISVFL